MSFAHQVIDIVISGLVAGLVTFLVSSVAPRVAITVGVLFAGIYYFSRNPWASQNPEEINELIDGIYDRLLPF